LVSVGYKCHPSISLGSNAILTTQQKVVLDQCLCWYF